MERRHQPDVHLNETERAPRWCYRRGVLVLGQPPSAAAEVNQQLGIAQDLKLLANYTYSNATVDGQYTV